MKKLLAAASALALGAALPLGAPTHAAALTTTKGYAGVCKGVDALTGTTIAVDFQKLNGNAGLKAPTLVRCSPNHTGVARNGIKALQDAGFALTGTTGWGLGFVCRIENRPTATEVLKRASSPTYRETCATTPPADAFWSYWVADGSGTSWGSSAQGAMLHTVIPGGFEGWSFTLGLTSATSKPRVTPRNPAIVATTPTASLQRSDPDGVIALGQSVRLTWYTRYTRTRVATQSSKYGGGFTGAVATSGVKVLKPATRGRFVYTLKVTSSNGKTATATQVITVK